MPHRSFRAKFALALAVLPLLTFTGRSLAATPNLCEDVDPRIGTAEHGHVFPGATLPLGMVQLSPDTRQGTWDGASGYHYSDGHILGFSQTHLSGTGVGDLGDIRTTPTVGDVRFDVGDDKTPGYRSAFSHDQEKASPGFYSVRLSDYDVTAELTAARRASMQRYTFPQSDQSHVILDLFHALGSRSVESEIHVENDHTITGHRQADGWGGRRTYYFAMEFSTPFTGSGIRSDGNDVTNGDGVGKDVRAHVDFKTTVGQQIVVRTGISTVSVDGAKQNLTAEFKDFDFDAAKVKAQQAWNDALGKVQIDESDKSKRRTFYTALYHTLLAPTLMSDVDGQYRGNDGNVHKADGFEYFTELSLWDTFRAEHPLLTLTQPNHVNDFVQTMLAHGDNSDIHALPVWVNAGRENWCMIGDHAIPPIVEAYAKGFRGFNAKHALELMISSVENDRFEKDRYREHGFIPHDPAKDRQTVSKTLEYAYDDSCIARFATAIGDADAAKKYGARASSWKNVLDPETKLMRGKNADGTWVTPFDPRRIDFHDYTEANAWQYSFFVPQDVPGLIEGMGGNDAFVRKLDEMFDTTEKIPNLMNDVTGVIGMYAHGNEPDQHDAYLYNEAGRPDQTAKRVWQIADLLYNDSPAGLCGNDDCGQTSAWFVFSALGFYPVDPASAVYQIGTPFYRETSMSVGDGKTFKVTGENVSKTHLYVQSATLNGKPLDRTWIRHAEIVAGGELKLVMGDKPSAWGRTVVPVTAAAH